MNKLTIRNPSGFYNLIHSGYLSPTKLHKKCYMQIFIKRKNTAFVPQSKSLHQRAVQAFL
jgi:hypothetical protein